MSHVTIQQALAQAKKQLSAAAENASLEAEILLAHTISASRSFLFAHAADQLTEQQLQQFNHYLTRRGQGEPIAYITGSKEFWSLNLNVSPDTLIPRPETEFLVEEALRLFEYKTQSIKVADLGTGSGAIALAIASERPTWEIFATDISAKALRIASKNAHELGINNISFCEGSWCTALPCSNFDMVISNPPYIALNEWEDYAAGLAYEPITALVSGEDGLDAIREISQEAKAYLKPGGYLLIEHGFLQGPSVCKIFAQDGYERIRTIQDLAEHERVTVGQVI